MADHIQIGDISPRVRYTGDGSTTGYAFPFAIFTDQDIDVYIDDTLQVLTDDYTVTGAGESYGGSVSFDTAPANGMPVTLVRRLSIKRLSDFLPSGDFKASVINDELDFQTAVLQQIDDDMSRSIRLQRSDAAAQLEVPDVAARAGRVLTFDGEGNVASSAFVDLPETANISTLIPAAPTLTGSAGASLDISAADHTHPRPGLSDIGMATQAEAEAGITNSKGMTPLRTAQAVDALIIGYDQTARDMAASALAYALAVNDATSITGSIGAFLLSDDFETDSLTTQTNATYDAAGDFYHNPGTLSSADAVPTMTGYVTSGVTIAESGSAGGHEGWRIFDDFGDAYASSWASSSNSNQWLTIDFGTPTVIGAYQLRPRNIDSNDLPMAPTAFHLDGWNGTSWDTLDNRTGISWGAHAYQQFAVTNPVAYSKYRFYGVSNSSGYEISIGEMELLPLTDPPDMTVAPSATTLSSADPTDVVGYFVFDPIDSVTFGSDVIGKYSIDNGVTKAAGAWTKVGNIGVDGHELWRLDADVSGQTGSSLIWEITTANNKQIELHACVGLVAIY